MTDGRTLKTTCCITGGGPAGIMLGFLLARAGVEVVVLEEHADFFRDFRGDTVHPSTLQVMDELGLLDDFLKVPHSEIRQLTGRVGSTTLTIGDFSRVPGRCKFVAFMPQWDFLNFLAEKARAFPSFRLMMQTRGTDLVYENGRVCGVTAQTADGPLRIEANLVVAADGRHSTLRERAGLEIIDVGSPIDALWVRIGRDTSGPGPTFGNVGPGMIVVAIDRGTYLQCAIVIRKGAFDEIRAAGLEKFRARIVALVPSLAPHIGDIASWDDVKLLTVTVNRLRTWYRSGLLCIGDAAHAMSPVGGVGINLAIQDAVATSNLLAKPLRSGGPITNGQLQAVQDRREWPTKMTQGLQVFIQNQVLNRALSAKSVAAPAPVRMLLSLPIVRQTAARIVGVGFRPEHVNTTAA